VALVCATFPLIWVGGLVTTNDAGMAVPDWPNTYGYNLFLYPWQTWIYGPWELFIEHGHRLLGSLVGMLAIAMVVASWWCGATRAARWASVLLLAGVIGQGVLGGMRVIEDQVRLAKIHGCFGPLVFALAVAVAAITSRRWRQTTRERSAILLKIERLAAATTLLAYVQLVLGSQLRHLAADARPGDFRIWLVFHLVCAALLLVQIMALAVATVGTHRHERWLIRPAMGLVTLVCLQLGLGAATWVTKYGWPGWMGSFDWAAGYTVLANGRPQAWITTAHVAIGSLILVTSLLTTLRAWRLAARASAGTSTSGPLAMEAAR
jgi:cytochrome c oxidase assembly protein subunit 15